ncbi:MAG: hypothetical protein AAGA72_00310 [Pseudomonadota bacterium]
MSPNLDPEDVFEEFTMEEEISHALLKTYIDRYPDLAIELTDLFHEITLAEARAGAEEVRFETKSAQPQMVAVGKLQAAFSNEGIRELAKQIGLPRDFLAGFRDRRIRFGSTPEPVLSGLSRMIGVRLHDFVRYLSSGDATGPALAFKADGKPARAEQMDYAAFIEGLALTSEEEAALSRLAQSDGSN